MPLSHRYGWSEGNGDRGVTQDNEGGGEGGLLKITREEGGLTQDEGGGGELLKITRGGGGAGG